MLDSKDEEKKQERGTGGHEVYERWQKTTSLNYDVLYVR